MAPQSHRVPELQQHRTLGWVLTLHKMVSPEDTEDENEDQLSKLVIECDHIPTSYHGATLS